MAGMGTLAVLIQRLFGIHVGVVKLQVKQPRFLNLPPLFREEWLLWGCQAEGQLYLPIVCHVKDSYIIKKTVIITTRKLIITFNAFLRVNFCYLFMLRLLKGLDHGLTSGNTLSSVHDHRGLRSIKNKLNFL